jgi:hypothetical protein
MKYFPVSSENSQEQGYFRFLFYIEKELWKEYENETNKRTIENSMVFGFCCSNATGIQRK